MSSRRPVYEARYRHFRRLLHEEGKDILFAEKTGWAQTYVSQLKTKRKPIGDDAAERIEQAYGLEPGALDSDPNDVIQESPLAYSDFTRIPSYHARAAAGSGAQNHQEIEVPGGFLFKKESIRNRGLIGKKLACIFARGDSMEPTISDRDLLLVNMTDTDVRDGGVYAVRWGDDLRVKRLFKRPSGDLTVRSDNPDRARFPDESVSAQDPWFSLIGRIEWRGGWV